MAESNPEKIIKVPISLQEGITEAQIQTVVEGLTCSGDPMAAGEQIRALYQLFVDRDCSMVEVNPLAEDAAGTLIAADAKIGFDDNAAFRQADVFAQRDESQEDAREVAASKWDLNYIGLDGEIGCMVNGAGLAMATMDIVSMHGGTFRFLFVSCCFVPIVPCCMYVCTYRRLTYSISPTFACWFYLAPRNTTGTPANFLDVGGSATTDQITAAFKIITEDPAVKAILVNIFGGIMQCDIIASGIVEACKTLSLDIPLVVRLEGTNVEMGKQILKDSGLAIIAADDLDDAAIKAVAAI